MKKLNSILVLSAVVLSLALSCKKAAPAAPQTEPTAVVSTWTTTATATSTHTAAAFTHTATATAILVDTSTATATYTRTQTFTEIQTATETATNTRTRTSTEIDTASATPTLTDIVTGTETPSSTETCTITQTPTLTPEPPASSCSFGVTGPGSYYGGVTGDVIRFSRFSTSTQITLFQIAYYISVDAPWTNGTHEAAVYSNSSSNKPQDRLAISGPMVFAVMSGPGWNVVDIPPTTLPPGTYWLGVHTDVATIAYNINSNYPETLGGWYGGSFTDPYSNGPTSGSDGYSIRGICE